MTLHKEINKSLKSSFFMESLPWESPSLIEKRKKHWQCQRKECNESNYIRRDICRGCNYPRKGLVLAQNKIRLGDWFCEKDECFERNFGFRKECRRCDAERAPNNDPSAALPLESLVTYNMNRLFI